MIDVGLVGFGFSGRTFHAPIIRSVAGLRLAAIVQRHGYDAAEVYSDVRVVRSTEEMLAIDSVRLIVIATTNATHFELAKQCLLSRRDVVVDKPFTTTYAEAAELAQIAERERRLLSVYHNRRWDGDFLTVQQLLRKGTLGRLVLFESHFDRFRPQLRPGAWRERAEPGSGILLDLGPHLIDQAMVLFGRPRGVGADLRLERDGAMSEDAFDVALDYPNLHVVLRATVLASAPTPRFVMHGTQGGYVKFGLDPQEDALKRGEVPTNRRWGQEPQEKWGTLRVLENGSLVERAVPTLAGDYRRYYENIRDALLGQTELAVTTELSLAVMRALELARESSRTRCAIPWPS
jgi:predicted dehydrogenase